jgi:hypothetical protein
MYVKYNAVLRGQGGLLTGGTSYSATIYLICSGLRKLSRTTTVPEGMVVYRGNGDMALPLDFLEPDAQVYSLPILPCNHSRLYHSCNSHTVIRAMRAVWSGRSCRPRHCARWLWATRA